MIRDPFYQDIVKRLGGRLDPELFERCAVDLLRDTLPTLVPIRGGSDAGMDGAVADGEGQAYPLVSTTGKDVIGNLSRSLDSYLSKGGDRRRVVLATSQELSGRRRRNLQDRAKKKEFELVQIFDQAAFADRLYRDPAWCRELLNLTGAPSALSAVPPTRRPLLGIRVVGREHDLSWLRESSGDRLLVGPSGSGKTFLLHSLVLEGWGLFLVSDDPSEIVGAIRSQRPGVMIVDDAHLDPERLNQLRRLREEIGAGFSIMATAWEGEHERVAETLNLPDSQVHHLELLSRDQIVEVVEESGVRWPLWLVKEIVDQAEGKPGLAVTLSHLCLRGGVREVALGEHLKRHTANTFNKSIGPEATQVLAAFALGGDAGIPMSVVSRELGMPTHELYTAVTQLSVGGVIDKAKLTRSRFLRRGAPENSDEENLTVRPPNLRYALVRSVFFCDGPRLPHRAFTDAAPDASELARTLVRSAYGARISSELLVSALERAGKSAPWGEYAALGPAEAEWILHNHPEATIAVARPALMVAPEATIPRLLDLAVGDERPLSQYPEHPLRLLEEWVSGAEPGTNQAVPRREVLIEAVAKWIAAGGDELVGTQALCLAMSPSFSDLLSDPGSGMRGTMRFGLLRPEELSALEGCWGRVVKLIGSLKRVSWKHLLELFREWAYPRHDVPGREELLEIMRPFAMRMLADLAGISKGHPGMLRQVSVLARRLGHDLEVALDAEFETLYPENDRPSSLRSREDRQVSAVNELADRWASSSNPIKVANRIQELEDAAASVGISYPRYTPLLCQEIAERTRQRIDWLRALLKSQVANDLIAPFLDRAARTEEEGWEQVAHSLLEDPSRKPVVIEVVLTLPKPPSQLLSVVLAKLEGMVGLVEYYSAVGHIPKGTLARLLVHDDPKICAAAALGEWQAEPKGNVRIDLLCNWRAAISRAQEDDYELGEVLKTRPTLAHGWLRRAVAASSKTLLTLTPGHAVVKAVAALDHEQRLSVLRAVHPSSMHNSLVRLLVGDDLDLYRRFLADPKLTNVHLWPLNGRPVGLWPEKAKLALAAGFSANEVAYAAYGDLLSWEVESLMWQGWAEQFAKLCSHEDTGVRAAAEIGREHAQKRREKALEEEQLEAIYGRA